MATVAEELRSFVNALEDLVERGMGISPEEVAEMIPFFRSMADTLEGKHPFLDWVERNVPGAVVEGGRHGGIAFIRIDDPKDIEEETQEKEGNVIPFPGNPAPPEDDFPF